MIDFGLGKFAALERGSSPQTYNRAASANDRQMFSAAGAPESEASLEDAKVILAGSKEKISLLAKRLY